MRRILVTSAGGANGDGYGTLLAFSAGGELAGPFCDDPRIADPRGLSLSPAGDLVYVTSGDDLVVALDRNGSVALDSGRTQDLDGGGGTFAPDGRYCITLRRRGTILALPPLLDSPGEPLLPDGTVPFPRGFGFGDGGQLYLSSGIGPAGQGDNTITLLTAAAACSTRAWSATLSSAHSTSRSLPAATSSSPASGHSARPAPRPRSANTTRRPDGWSAYSHRTPPCGSPDPAGCGSAREVSSTGSARITSSPLTSPAGGSSA
jgi:hypothetical protein